MYIYSEMREILRLRQVAATYCAALRLALVANLPTTLFMYKHAMPLADVRYETCEKPAKSATTLF